MKSRVISIAGSSGVGKTTLANIMTQVIGIENVCRISGDDLHLWKRDDKNWKKFTHLNPQSNNISLGETHIKRLKSGDSISRKVYDHSTGDFLPTQIIHSNKWIVHDGLHSLSANMPSLSDIRIFVETDNDLKVDWKIKRDTTQRGYTRQEVLKAIRSREDDELLYILPQKKNANVVVKFDKSDEGNVLLSYTCLDTAFRPLLERVKKFYDALIGFVNLCKRLSLDPALVQGRGGNVSVKVDDHIIVTSSGSKMSDVSLNQDFCVCNRNAEISCQDENQFMNDIRNSKTSGKKNPSMELAFHLASSNRVCAHTHPIHVNSILCSTESRDILKNIFPTLDYVYVDYKNPGLELYKACSFDKNVLFLENHGMIIFGNDERQVLKLTEDINNKCKAWLADNSDSFISFSGSKLSKGHLFPDSTVFPIEMSLTNAQIEFNILAAGLNPRYLSSDIVQQVLSMDAEKDRQQR